MLYNSLAGTVKFPRNLSIHNSIKVYDLIYMMVDQANPILPDVQPLLYLFYRESFIVGNKSMGRNRYVRII